MINKFRGKILDGDGHFEYGDLLYDRDKNPFIHFFDCNNFECLYEIIPESIGQYTGLKDKNGIEIYENDILLLTSDIYTNFGRFKTDRIDKTVKQVIWNIDTWATKVIKSNLTVVGSQSNGLTIAIKYAEVIGNIYENSNLLEG